MRVRKNAIAAMTEGLGEIRTRYDIPTSFPADVTAAAEAAIRRPFDTDHVDRTDIPFVTLDPAASTDLDQAFALERSGSDMIIRYAIADVGWFVQPGDALDTEAFKRAVTVYLPDGRASLYPTILSEGAASLLPDVERPAVIFTVRVASDGAVTIDGIERARIRSRAKLAYETATADELPDGIDEVYQRITAAEAERGSPRVEFPEQEIDRDENGQYVLSFRPRALCEEQNASLSLATNLAVGALLYKAHTGMFRVMPDVDERHLKRLRVAAQALGLEWKPGVTLDQFQRSLRRDDPRASAFLLTMRRISGGAAYEAYTPDHAPWHGAMKSVYAQATAPLRRLQDRYVIAAAMAVANDRPVPDDVTTAFTVLPKAMAAGEQRANRAERAAVELAEAVALSERVGDIFTATVVDEGDFGVEVQIDDPAVMVRMVSRHVDPGDVIKVRLISVDVAKYTVTFERVS